MDRIAIIYFSGVGNTKAVAQVIRQSLQDKAETDIFSIEHLPEKFNLIDYSAVVIGAPAYHSEPAQPMMSFIRSISNAGGIPAFVFVTCGMYPENSLRKLAVECERKGIVPVVHASYRCAATDGILLTPWMKRWYENEKNLRSRIQKDTERFLHRLSEGAKRDMPGYKWYAPLNYPNRMLGRAVTFPIYLHGQACTGCGKCAAGCPRSAVAMKDGRPEINRAKCMNCYRCVHHCPSLALSLSRRKRVEKVWHDTLRMAKN